MFALVLCAAACGNESRSTPGSGGGGGRRTALDSGVHAGDDAANLDSGPAQDAQGRQDAQARLDAQTGVDRPTPADAGFADSGFADAIVHDTGFAAGHDAGMPATNAGQQIAAVRAAVDGPLAQPIDGALVTFVKPALGDDAAGFFVQAQLAGPALFVRVDPASLNPSPRRGDIVQFTVTERATMAQLITASAITGYAQLGAGAPISGLVQELSQAADLVTGVGQYESELARVSGTLASGFRYAGQGHVAARIETASITGVQEFELRLSNDVFITLGLGLGCQLTVVDTPVWRFNETTQLIAYTVADLAVASCPAPKVIGAVARRPDLISISFDRMIAAASVDSGGSQIALSNGLQPTSAAVVNNLINVGTTAQSPGVQYTVTVGSSIMDARGTPLDPAFRTTSFTGVAQSAVVRINELNANIDGACDLIELRAVTGGSLDGWTLQHRRTTLVAFTNLTVQPNDYIVVHINGASADCNPAGAGNEASSKTEFARATHSANYDTAYDWYATTAGMQRTDTTLLLFDANGAIADAALFSDDSTGTAARDSERGAEDAANLGEWTTQGGTIPPGGFVDEDFSANAVLDLDATGTTAAGTSIQRSNDLDSNDRTGWTDGNASTWGANNPGQSNF